MSTWVPKIAVLFCLLLHYCAMAQTPGAAEAKPRKKGNIFKFAINAVKRTPADTTIISAKSETPFLQYKNKIIRHITVKQFGFEQTFADTAKKINYFGTNLLNHLHRNSKDWVIKDNIFLKENTPLNPYKVADNERYIRSLEFIQDARILVKPVAGDTSSVDLEVITKDLFSISGNLSDFSSGSIKGSVSDANVLGMGQKVEVGTVIQSARDPHFGYSVSYNKLNVAHTFVNAGFGYSTINPDLQNIALDERAWYVSLQRPLVSQYSHMAGGLVIGHHQSYNSYAKPNHQFYDYAYNTFDVWAGYNLGINRHLQNSSLKDRRFVSLRYFKNDFSKTPYQADSAYNFRYNNRQAVLGQFTFFKQDFYKTNYIYGFGNTEDVPNGYNIAVTSGWYKQADLSRAYAGVDANLYMASNKGDFLQYFIRTGFFMHHNNLQDGALLLGTSVFTRLMVHNDVKMRGYFNISYTRLFNRTGLDPLNLNNIFGLRNFNADSVMGIQRLSLYAETFMFLKYKLFGFKFAPFAFVDGALLTPEDKNFAKSDIYYGLGGGVRTRNENLIFNTIQLRFVYFPRSPQGNNSFKLTLAANINFRYNSNYVNKPDIVQLNADNTNGIY